MKRLGRSAIALIATAGGLVCQPGATAGIVESAPHPFKAADLKVEINATDGDAGLQIFLDDDAWNEIRIVNPAGAVMVDLQATGPLEDYGLTELFSESSEPPFSEFPLEDFKKLFPEGDYVFTGILVDGTKLRSEVPLTHDFPAGPRILKPADGAHVSAAALMIRWAAADTPPGVDIVGYQVIVVREDDTRTLQADLGASARKFRVPKEYLERGTEYKAEVLAIDASGNQTLTEVTFTVK